MPPSPQTIWNLNPTELNALLESEQLKPTSNTIHLYAPSFTYYKTKHYHNKTNRFPTITVTGKTCALNCKHCGGKVLQTMNSAQTPTELYELGKKLKVAGAEGVLVSGGSLQDGSVPLESFVEVLEHFKRELNLTVFVHTGIIQPKSAQALKKAGVEAALIDVIGSQKTINEVTNLKSTLKDYTESLNALQDAKLQVIPHVIVGLQDGKLDGEYQALEMIRQIQPSAIVIIAFMPIPNTEMAHTPPPTPTDIAKVIAVARSMFPNTPLTLGCMRPKGKTRLQTDVLALKAGVDAVAFPSEAAIEYIKNKDLETTFSPFCCAQIFWDLRV
jgi:lipoyl synthase